MIGNGHPAEAFRRPAQRPEVSRFSLAEFGDAESAWILAGRKKAAVGRKPWRFAAILKAVRAASARIAAMLF